VREVSGPLRRDRSAGHAQARASSGRAFVPETRSGAGHLKKLAT